MWQPGSKSARSQVSAALFYVRISPFVRATDDTRASRLQAKGRRRYLSQNFGPAVAGSAGPAPPPLQGVRAVSACKRMLYSYQQCTMNT